MSFTKRKLAAVAVVVAAVGVSAGWSAAGAVPSPRNAPKDEEKVQGAWRLVYAECRGQPLPPHDVANLKLVMQAEKHVLFEGGKQKALGTHRLNPTQKPKTIDITEDEGPNPGQSNRGIYLLEDDLFILCYNLPHMGRPTTFTSTPDSTVYLFIYKRAKP